MTQLEILATYHQENESKSSRIDSLGLSKYTEFVISQYLIQKTTSTHEHTK